MKALYKLGQLIEFNIVPKKDTKANPETVHGRGREVISGILFTADGCFYQVEGSEDGFIYEKNVTRVFLPVKVKARTAKKKFAATDGTNVKSPIYKSETKENHI